MGAMGIGDCRTAVPPGVKSARRAVDPGEVWRSWRAERGDSGMARAPSFLTRGCTRGEATEEEEVRRAMWGAEGRATSL